MVFAALLAAVCVVPELAAQSITSGDLSGRALDTSGQPVAQARVLLESEASGWRALVLTGTGGDFRFTRVPPGAYELFVEIVGYRPVRVLDLPVRPGQSIRVSVALTPEEPPVTRVDTLYHGIGVPRLVTPGGGRWITGQGVNDYPDRLRALSSVAALSSRFDAYLGSEGLPASMTQTFVDGVAFTPARHPFLPGGGPEGLILPRSGVAYMAMPEAQADIELQGGTGGYTAVGLRSSEQDGSFDVFGAGSTERLWASPGYSGVPATRSIWGGASASLPLIPDTARLFLAVEGYETETPRLPILSNEDALALPGLSERSEELSANWVERLQSFSGVARVDWTLSEATSLEVGASVAALGVWNGLAMRSPALYGTTPPLDALDMLVTSTLTTRLFAFADLEFRAGFQRSVREYRGERSESTPGTWLVDSGAWVGLDPSLPARVTRTSFVGGPTVHFFLGQRHKLKTGVQLSVPSFSYESPSRGVGSFAFSSASAVATGDGAFTHVSGTRPVGSFSLPRVSTFAQYAWSAVPGLEVAGGLRYDAEYLPTGDLVVDREWSLASGLRADSMESRLDKLSARVGLTWDLTGQGSTVLGVGAGMHHGDMDPASFSEALSFGGGIEVRRSVDDLGAWPILPTSADVPVTGERIAQLSPRLESPRTRRGYLGLWQLLGERTVLQLSGSVRRTDFLMRRSDLNLAPAPSGLDPFGRPVFGQLVQRGSVLTSMAGSNRRFEEFDQVWALNPDGWSQRIAATAALDHGFGERWKLFGSYTWSRTEDNWLGAASGRPDAALDPGLDDILPQPWSEGTSDFDVPHRAVAALSLRLSGLTVRGTYRFRSDYPFTAGYRAGVDANGDGSALNDVAFVLDDPAVLELAQDWDCLDTSLNRFVKRNGCRGKGVHALDVRVALDLLPSRSRHLQLVVEGFNLLESEVGLRDTALLLVDGSGALSIDPVTGDVDVPVTINPGFGRIMTSSSPGRMLRVGLRFGGGAR